MNLYVVNNITSYKDDDASKILNAMVVGASSYNQTQLQKIYKGSEVSLDKLVEQYNSVVRKTKLYAANDGLKARVIAVDEIYRRIYNVFNKRHFNVFVKVFMSSFGDYEKRIKKIIEKNLNDD